MLIEKSGRETSEAAAATNTRAGSSRWQHVRDARTLHERPHTLAASACACGYTRCSWVAHGVIRFAGWFDFQFSLPASQLTPSPFSLESYAFPWPGPVRCTFFLGSPYTNTAVSHSAGERRRWKEREVRKKEKVRSVVLLARRRLKSKRKGKTARRASARLFQWKLEKPMDNLILIAL